MTDPQSLSDAHAAKLLAEIDRKRNTPKALTMRACERLREHVEDELNDLINHLKFEDMRYEDVRDCCIHAIDRHEEEHRGEQ